MIIDYMTEIYKHPCFHESWWFPFSVKVHSANSEVSDALGYCDDWVNFCGLLRTLFSTQYMVSKCVLSHLPVFENFL